MRYYPIFMNLQDCRCLVAGAGTVGLRKIRSLVEAKALEILVVDPKDCELPEYAGIIHKKKYFEEQDLAGRALVFAATDRRTLNCKIAALCRERGILCNVADSPAEGTFVTPSCFSSRELDMAVGTKGASPAMAARICGELGAAAENRYGPMLRLMAKLRPLILELEIPAEKKRRILKKLALSRLTELLSAHKIEEAERLLRSLVPDGLHAKTGELLHDDQ